jgi:hypothetical protein
MQTYKAKFSINWLWTLDLMKFKLLNTHSSSIESWQLILVLYILKCCNDGIIKYYPSHFSQRVDGIKNAQDNLGIIFHYNFEIEFLHI